MTKPLLIGLALSLAASGAVLAQSATPNDTANDVARRAFGIQRPQTGGANNTVSGRGADTNPTDRPRSNLPDIQQQSLGLDVDTPASNVPPANWRGDTASWDAHRRACAARYPSYDAQSDTYAPRQGARERCTL